MKIAPSILTADFTKLNEEIKSISEADLIHIDVMDGNFVPNISFGPAITKQINDISNINLDVHLMVLNPVEWIKKFSFNKVEYITIHYEANNYKEALKLIKKENIKAGLSIKPQTKVEEIKKDLANIDLVLIMSVEPGFGGQKLIESTLDKIEELIRIREANNYKYVIQIDGGVNSETIEKVKKTNVDIAVVGSYIFNQKDRNKVIKELKCE